MHRTPQGEGTWTGTVSVCIYQGDCWDYHIESGGSMLRVRVHKEKTGLKRGDVVHLEPDPSAPPSGHGSRRRGACTHYTWTPTPAPPPMWRLHEDAFPHHHLTDEEKVALEDAVWRLDNVEFTTVGIDVGSSTSHLMFSRVHLRRQAHQLSSRFVVIERRTLWSSPIRLTPFLDDDTIDSAELATFIEDAYRNAGLSRDDVDTGAVILTGEAVKRKNASAIAALFASDAGKFVCASAGHHMECVLAAHGSGAAALSKNTGKTVLNCDIGGGTTKLAYSVAGGQSQLHVTCAVAVGGRLIAFDDAGRVARRLDDPAANHRRAACTASRLPSAMRPRAARTSPRSSTRWPLSSPGIFCAMHRRRSRTSCCSRNA